MCRHARITCDKEGSAHSTASSAGPSTAILQPVYCLILCKERRYMLLHICRSAHHRLHTLMHSSSSPHQHQRASIHHLLHIRESPYLLYTCPPNPPRLLQQPSTSYPTTPQQGLSGPQDYLSRVRSLGNLLPPSPTKVMSSMCAVLFMRVVA